MRIHRVKAALLYCFIAVSGALSAQGTWSTLPHISSYAIRQSSLLLDNNKVITNSHHYFGDVYDPVKDTILPFQGHGFTESAVAKLHNGLILYSGGISLTGNHFDTLSMISLYNPVSNLLTRSLLHHPAKGGHTATLLPNQKVLLAGGVRNVGVIAIIDDPFINDTVWFNGRKPEFFKVYASCQLFDPADTSLLSTTPMQSPRVRHRAVLLNSGKVLVAGGRDAGSRPLKSCELYDPLQESWVYTDSLPFGLSRFQLVTLPDGDVLLSGGTGIYGATDLCLRYSVATQSWQKMSSMHHKRFNHTMTVLNSGEVLVTGGGNTEVLSSAELYDPSSDSWSMVAPLSFAREEHSAVLLNSGKVLVIGGIADGVAIRQMELYQE